MWMSIQIEAPATDAVEEFLGRVMADAAGTMTTVMCALGDRLGLFEALAGAPRTSAELASAAGVDERYAREWCAVLTSAGYLEHDAGSGIYTLPPAHVPVLGDPTGPYSAGGIQQMLRGVCALIDPVQEHFRNGGGIPIEAYDDHWWSGLERSTGLAFDHRLVQEWVPEIAGLEERLTAGIDVADIGCGSGRALIRLAQAFPASRFHGFDIARDAIERAEAGAVAAGVADRVTFTRLDATGGVPGSYDVVTTFDVVHDAADPAALVNAARAALRPGGLWLVLEIHSHDTLAEAAGPIGTLLYGISVMHCMTVSLSNGGAGLGTCGVPESVLRRLCLEAGFASVRRVCDSPLDVLYEVGP
jgi:SAM-dependent methyltransferase